MSDLNIIILAGFKMLSFFAVPLVLICAVSILLFWRRGETKEDEI